MTTLRFTLSTIFILFFTYLDAQIYNDLEREGDLTFDEIVSKSESYFDDRGRGQGSGYKQFKRWEYFTRRSLSVEGKIITNTEAYRRTKAFLYPKNQWNRNSYSAWTEMGPKSAINTSTWSSHLGRISAVAINPLNSNHIIVGSPGGGVWHTFNEGMTWEPIFDDQALLNVYSLLIDQSNTYQYFAGTSGLGLLRSPDRGQTWMTSNGITSSDNINAIIQNPNNSDILIASSQWGEIFQSVDGGLNWTEVYSASSGIYLYDLEFKPGDPSIVYASGDGVVLKSTDSGATFQSILGPWNTGALMMAVTPDDPNFIYVLEESGGGFGALYRSTTNGNTWFQMSNDNAGNNNIMGYNLNDNGGQAPRDMDVVVSPTNKLEVHVAGIMTNKSTDGGVTWNRTTHWVISNPLPFIHADCDLMIYQNNKIYFGTDGGFFISNDAGVTYEDRSQGIGVRQFYRIGVSKTELDRVSGGSQDNGTGVLVSGGWIDFVGADGMETFIDKNDEDVIYASIQYGGLYKSENGGLSLTGIDQIPGSGDWVTPLEQDPIDANTLYQGKQQVYKSTNGGDDWTQISNLSPANGNDTRLTEITVAPSNNDVIYASFRYQLFKTENGGADWFDVTPNETIYNINYISVHPTNSDKVLLCMSGSEKVMESIDGGMTWISLDSGLPSVGAQCAIYEGSGGGIYLAMNPGVFYRNSANPNWESISLGLPNVNVTELEIEHGYLYAATYGRGLWRADISMKYGCTDLLAHNFDSLALIDDGSCLTCSDGIQNGDEGGIDCGGAICDLCTVMGGTCPHTLDLTGLNIVEGLYTADQTISSNNLIDNQINVRYESGGSIDLLNNFEVELGTEFEARIQPCTPQ